MRMKEGICHRFWIVQYGFALILMVFRVLGFEIEIDFDFDLGSDLDFGRKNPSLISECEDEH